MEIVSKIRIELEHATSPYAPLFVNVSAEFGIAAKNVERTALLLTCCHLERVNWRGKVVCSSKIIVSTQILFKIEYMPIVCMCVWQALHIENHAYHVMFGALNECKCDEEGVLVSMGLHRVCCIALGAEDGWTDNRPLFSIYQMSCHRMARS
jgi:hypothetical protein